MGFSVYVSVMVIVFKMVSRISDLLSDVICVIKLIRGGLIKILEYFSVVILVMVCLGGMLGLLVVCEKVKGIIIV